MKKILFIGDSPESMTTWGRMSSMILDKISSEQEDYRVHCICPDLKLSKYYRDYFLQSIDSSIEATVYEAIRQHQPDLIFTLGNIEDIAYMYGMSQEMSARGWKWVCYTDTKYHPVNPAFVDLFKSASMVIVGTQCLSDELKNIGVDAGKLKIIPYGYNSKIYFTVTDKKTFKKQGELSDSFNIMYITRNTFDANINNVMEVVSRLAEDGKKILFYLHTIDAANYAFDDILQLSIRHGIDNITITPKKNGDKNGVDDFDINLLCNINDVAINMNMSASVHTTLLEAMTCGCNVITTDTPANCEIFGKDRCVSCQTVGDKFGSYKYLFNKDELFVKLNDLYSKWSKGELQSNTEIKSVEKYDFAELAGNIVHELNNVITRDFVMDVEVV